MTAWQGKTRGGLLGYKIFVFVLKHFGLAGAYFILLFVAAWFLLFAPRQSTALYSYFRVQKQYNSLRSFLSAYRVFYIFGQTLIDKVAIGAGMKDRFSYRFEGHENLVELGESGGIVFSAHLGNWEVASYLMKENRLNSNILMFEAEHEKIKDYLKEVMTEQKVNIIPIKADMSHVFKINGAIQRKEILCVHGDRFIEGSRVLRKTFMGREAFFPIGPFSIASKLRVPYTFAYAFREKRRSYSLSSTPVQIAGSNPEEILDQYIAVMEEKLRNHPLQWFNFYDFWSTKALGATMS